MPKYSPPPSLHQHLIDPSVAAVRLFFGGVSLPALHIYRLQFLPTRLDRIAQPQSDWMATGEQFSRLATDSRLD